MRRAIFTFVCCLFLTGSVLAVEPKIVITEIGAYEKSGYEWVEIFNFGNEPVDLTGWKFLEGGVNHRLSASTTDSIVEAGEYAVIVQDEQKFKSQYPDFAGSIFDSSWGSLKESGEEIGLQDKDKNLIEQFIYLKATKFSLQRKDVVDDYSSNNWQEHSDGNSVGKINSFASVVVEVVEVVDITPTSTVLVEPEENATSTVPLVEEVIEIPIAVPVIEQVSSTPPVVIQVTSTLMLPALPAVVELPQEEIKIVISEENVTTTVEKAVVATPIISKQEKIKEEVILNLSSTTNKLSEDKIIKDVKSKTINTVLYLDISQARLQAKGTKVQVSGVVSVLSGILGSQYLYIQDQTGGIQIYQYKKDFPLLQIGDQVSVYGEISESRGQKRIKIEGKGNIKVLQTNFGVSAVSSSLSNLDSTSLGLLVKIFGMITDIKGNYIYIDDGVDEIQVYLKEGAKIDKSKCKEGQNIELIGILEQGSANWQIWPRSSSDLKVFANSSTTAGAQGQDFIHEVGDAKQETKKYLVVTAGGISSVLLGFVAKARGGLAWQGVKKATFFIIGLIKK